MKLATFKQGESVTLGFSLPTDYDLDRIDLIKCYLGSKLIANTITDNVVRCELTSEYTKNLYGDYKLVFWLDDSELGVKKTYTGDITFNSTGANAYNESVNLGFDVLIELEITETTISVSHVLYNYFKGDKGDIGSSIVSVELISTVGLIKTYRQTYSDGSTFEYDVKDGEDGTDAVLPDNIVIDANYVHTDNNLTDELVDTINGAAPSGHNHSGQSINPDNVILSKQYTDLTMVDLAVGAVFYNVDQLCWLLKLSDVNYYNFGEELPMLSKNGDTSTHTEGTAVYISSGSGQLAVVKRTSSTIGKCNALATADVLNTGNGRGYYCFFGAVRQFPYANVKKSTDNENTWIDGAELFLCSESGKYSTTKEDAPAKSIKIGTITNRSGSNITVMFTPDSCLSVDDLCDVDGNDTTIADTDEVLKKDANGLWKKVTWANVKVILNGIFGRLATINTWDLFQTFTTGIKTPKITPTVDSTTAFQITKADTTTPIFVIDSTNKRLGLGVTPQKILHLYNSASISIEIRNENGAATWDVGLTSGGNYNYFQSGIGDIFTLKNGGNVGINNVSPETKLDVKGTTTLRDYAYFNNGVHTGDAIGDFRNKTLSGVSVNEICTVANATRGSGTWKRTSGVNEFGGKMISLTNKTGANSVKGTVVYASATTDNSFNINPLDGDMPIGVVYENAIADGGECWVVISGIAEVLLVDSVASTRSYVAYSSGTTAGRIDTSASVPAAATHFREVGHTLESKTAGTNILCKCILHFN